MLLICGAGCPCCFLRCCLTLLSIKLSRQRVKLLVLFYLWRRFFFSFQDAILVQQALRISAHSLRISVYETANLVEKLAVGPDEVEIINEFLNGGIRCAFQTTWQDVLPADLQLERLQIHRLLANPLDSC